MTIKKWSEIIHMQGEEKKAKGKERERERKKREKVNE